MSAQTIRAMDRTHAGVRLNRHEAVIEASYLRRTIADSDQRVSQCPDNAIDRYMLMMCDRPILPHHIKELRSRSRNRTESRLTTP